MMDAALTLIRYNRWKDSNGVWHDGEPHRREVFCQVESVGRNEFFAAGQNGIRPDYCFRVFAGEYDGERECEYNGEWLTIYRTYRPDAYARHNNYATHEGSIARNTYVGDADRVELYAGKRVGRNGETG